MPLPLLRRGRAVLSARWSDLVFLTFEAPEDAVRRCLPPPLEPDRLEGRTVVSLVALDFSDVRILGGRVPGLAAFPFVNLRTYVRHGPERGVLFVRQFVPSRLAAGAARLLYRQPFRAARLVSHTTDDGDRRVVLHQFGLRRQRHHVMVIGGPVAGVPREGTSQHFVIERRWGYGTTRGGRLFRFRVEREPWAVRRIERCEYQVDFEALYGREWAALNDRKPRSTVLAVGSRVTIHSPEVVA